MKCPQCGSENVTVQAVPIIKKKKHGALYWLCFVWLFDMLIWIFAFLPRLIIALLKRDRYVTKVASVAVCQSCGKSWRV